MKTAISIPNDVFASAEQLANQLGTSRSKLYTEALTSYIKNHKNDHITEKYNEAYADNPEPIDPVLMAMQMQALPKEDW